MNTLAEINTLSEFIDWYLQRGFGSINKTEYKKDVRELLKNVQFSENNFIVKK